MKAPNLNSNLIERSISFPEVEIDSEILFDVKIKDLIKKFSSQKEIIILEGPSGCGKTVTLMQFTKHRPHTTFSYFLKDDYWIQRPSAFLSSLCNQMSAVVGIPFDIHNDIKIDLERLKQIFETLSRKIIEIAKREKIPFYFVIDGLEWGMNGLQGERIIDLFPLPHHPRGLYILGSISSSYIDNIKFQCEYDNPNPFSKTETRSFLQELNLSDIQIDEIHKISGGMPGYLSLFKRMIKEKQISYSSIINNQEELSGLLDKQWNKEIEKFEQQGKSILSIIAYSLIPLNASDIAEITQISEDVIYSIVHGTVLLKRGRDSGYSFYPDVNRSIAQKKLKNYRDFALTKLSAFYKAHPENKSSLLLLPEYLRQMENYKELKALITPEYLINTILTQKDVSIAQHDLNTIIELAHRNNDWRIINYGLLSSQLRTLSTEVIGISEVEALIAMEKYDQALELAYSSKLDYLRIRLLAKIYLAMEQDGKTIPRDSIREIEEILENVKAEELDPEILIQLATDIFPLVPDKAIGLVDRVKLKESQRSPMDLFVLFATAISDDRESDNLIPLIQSTELQDIALMDSPWLSKLSAKEIILRGNQAKQTKAKDYLFRQWCLTNRKNEDVDLVIEAALDSILADPDYHIPLRHLRQLSEPLVFCKSDRKGVLARRFDAPSLVSLRSPIEERIRLEMNIVESLFQIDPQDAIFRYNTAYSSVDTEAKDSDVICYCLVRLWITAVNIDLPNKHNLIHSIKNKLDSEFISLIETAADQLKISRRILRSLTLVDPDTAITYSCMLNTVNRRNIGIQEVLSAYIRQSNLPINSEILNKGLDQITDNRIKEDAIYRIIEIGKESKVLDQEPLKGFAHQRIKQISDPVIYCRCCAYILSTINQNKEKALFDELFAELMLRWESIDIMWMRVEGAMHFASIIAEVDKKCAEQLYDQASALRGSFALANQTIGVMFFETLSIATRVTGKLNLENTETKQAFDNLLKFIDALPSQLLRLLLLSQIAMGRIRNGDKKLFDELIQEKILTELQGIQDSELKIYITSDIALCLFEYSPEEANSWVNKLPYHLNNITWYKIAKRILAGSNIYDQIDEEIQKSDLGIASINQVISILDCVERDQEFTDILTCLCRGIVDSNLNEVQKLDALTKIEGTLDKLPDPKNINHNGYKVLAESEIERARRLSAKKSKSKLPKNFSKIVKEAKEIENIADRVLVLAEVATTIKDCIDREKYTPKEEKQLPNQLLDEAYSLAEQIPNFRDRADRLEVIAKCYCKNHDMDKATVAITLAKKIALSLEEVERDQILASIIQTAHEIDKDLAAEISQKIEGFSEKYSSDIAIKSKELSKDPRKILNQYSEYVDDEIMQEASSRMIKAIVSGHGVAYPSRVVFDWLSTTKSLNFNTVKDIVDWAIEVIIRQTPDSELNQTSTNILNSLLLSCEMLYVIGNQISFLEQIPQDLKANFQGLSTNKRFYKVGEKNKPREFISRWLKSTAKGFVNICDPYFDPDQLWLLQCISLDIHVSIITTGQCLGVLPKKDKILITPLERKEKLKEEKTRLQTSFYDAWKQYSQQTPPPTLIIIHGTIFDTNNGDEFHDRYIITEGAGLSIGTSLNGFGNKEFFITVMNPDDVKVVCETYINPKLNIQEYFSKIIYFEL